MTSTEDPAAAPLANDSASATADSAVSPSPAKPAVGIAMQVVNLLASMKLSVVLLALLALLTWLGTLAQIEHGLWSAQKQYFESWGLIAELPLSFWGEPLFTTDDGKPWPLRVPLPGAYPVMALLFVNLMVGGFVRLKWRAKNAGILITHVGIALLLLAGFVKLEYSVSGRLPIWESTDAGRVQGRAYELSMFVSFNDNELALLKRVGDQIEERVVPESQLEGARDGTVTLRGEGLPFAVQVHNYLDNCRPRQKGPMVAALTPVVESADGGPRVFLEKRPLDKERPRNRPGCYVTILTDDGEQIDAVLDGGDMLPYDERRYPFTFEVAGDTYGLDLRRVVYDLPFSVRLNEFIKKDHPGTLTPADFRSKVAVREGDEQLDAQIYMNNPLRRRDYVLYQASWGPQINGRPNGGPPWFSQFEVSENPSDKWPEYACWIIGAGLLLHFASKLIRFLQSSQRRNLTEVSPS